MFPPKAEMQYWGHCGIGNVLPKIVKLSNIHQRLTRQKMRMDNLSSRRSALANFERCALFPFERANHDADMQSRGRVADPDQRGLEVPMETGLCSSYSPPVSVQTTFNPT